MTTPFPQVDEIKHFFPGWSKDVLKNFMLIVHCIRLGFDNLKSKVHHLVDLLVSVLEILSNNPYRMVSLSFSHKSVQLRTAKYTFLKKHNVGLNLGFLARGKNKTVSTENISAAFTEFDGAIQYGYKF